MAYNPKQKYNFYSIKTFKYVIKKIIFFLLPEYRSTTYCFRVEYSNYTLNKYLYDYFKMYGYFIDTRRNFKTLMTH